MSNKPQIENIFELTNMQEGMLYYSLLESNSNAYYETFKFVLNGDLDIEIFEKSFNKLIERHSSFRTLFKYNNVKKPLQVILKKRNLKCYFENLSGLSKEEQEDKIEVYNKEVGMKRYNLEKDLLIRVAIFKLKEKEFKVAINFHHIIMDGWCIRIVMGELFEIYKSIIEDTPLRLKDVPNSKLYYEWIRKQDKSEALQYWDNYLLDYRPSGNTIKLNNPLGSYNQKIYKLKISKDILDKVNRISVKYSATINTFFSAIWAILMKKYTSSNDIVFGSVVSGRPPEIDGIEEMVGVFINTIPVRVRVDNNNSFIDILKKCQKDKNDSMSYEYSSISEIYSRTELKQNIIDHIIVFENYPVDEGIKSMKNCSDLGLSISEVETDEQSNYDLNIVITPSDTLNVEFKYNKFAYSSDLIQSLAISIQLIFEQIVANENITIGELDIVDHLQKQKLLNTFNDTDKSYDNTKTLEKYFEEQVEKNPEKTAVIFNQDKLSYGELNKRANEIAWELKERGVNPGDKVAILLNRGLEVYTSIFAVLKVGAIYVPINDEYPNSRIDYMLQDSNAKVIITEESLKSRICRDINILLVNDEGLKNNPDSNLNIANTLNSVCYIIYTSGSTGQSKGTLVMHKNVIRVVKDNNYININENDIVLQISNHAFDGSVFDIFGALLNGSTLVGIDKDTILSVDKLSNVIATKGVTIAFMTTALFNVIVDSNLDALKGMKKILFGGERVSVEHVRRAFNTLGRDKLMHVYGPTETAVFATYYNIDKISENQVTVPIGKALTNTKLYVLDESLRLKPIGVQGQLYIGGDAVSLGYLNREDLNKEKFIKNPFNQEEIIYATGDLVRYLPSGDIEFLDRIDNQVKIRGFRIELGEIEKEILSNDKIKEAVVVAIEDENKNTVGLCAYYVCNGKVKKEDIKLSLMEKLPQYMIPSYYVQIEKMPLNANKKIDKKSLPAPDENSVIKNEYIEPTTEIEKKIAEVWKEVLSYDKISITDNFFELGGDSIKGIQVISKLKESGIKLEVKYLLNHPTILQLSKYIVNNDLSISQKLVQGEVPLTPIQKYFLEYNKGCNVNHFGQSVTLFSHKGFDEKLVGKVFEKLATHHDALRMTFKLEDNNFIQTNRGLSGDIYELDILDISYKTDDEKLDLINKRALEIQHMDLKNGPLFKGIIIRDSDGDHLYMAIHHFVVDGVSWRFIVEDFCKSYNSLNEEKRINIPPKTTSFKEWAEKLREYANSPEVTSEIEYWNTVVIDAETKLPVKKSMSNKVMNSNKLITALLSEKETEMLLTDVNRAFNTEIKDILITALALSINSWCGREKLAVNIEGHGREEIIKGVDITRTIGWFTSIFPVILQCNSGNISDQIIKTKETLNSIPNKGIGYGILRYLNRDNPIKSKEIPNVCFNYLGQADNVISKDDISISKLNINCDIGDEICSIYDLDISCIIKNKQLVINILYNDQTLGSHSINSFLNEYIGKLLDIIRYCIQYIKENKLDISQIKDIYNQPYIMLLNEKVDRNIFVFPPHMPKVAYSILYKNLSMYINDYSFYMFNFLETEKLVNYYVEKIKEIQGEGPYVLMGYSFGGALAFEAANRLIQEGREVSDVILVDSYVVEEDSFENINLEFVRSNVRESLKTQYKDVITNEEFLEEIVTSFINYYIYTKDFVNSKKPIPVNLHMLRGEGEVPNIRDTRHIWPTLTTKKYYEYTGVGTHNLMLSGSYLGTNAKIIVDILNNINRI